MAAVPPQALTEGAQGHLDQAGKRRLRLGALGHEHLAGARARELQDRPIAGDCARAGGLVYRAGSQAEKITWQGEIVPTISVFYGIQIMMYFYDRGKHNLPPIHAEYQVDEAVFLILDGEVISGDLPRKQTRLVQAWIELHRESLMVDWKLAVSGQEPYRIEPLH